MASIAHLSMIDRWAICGFAPMVRECRPGMWAATIASHLSGSVSPIPLAVAPHGQRSIDRIWLLLGALLSGMVMRIEFETGNDRGWDRKPGCLLSLPPSPRRLLGRR
jgi:hypothetical protein